MKKNILCIVLLTISFKLLSQDSKISFELNYPIPLGDNFIGESYTGIIDAGVDYKFVNLSPVKIGASLNGGILINNKSDIFKTTAYTIQPRLFGELNIESIEKLRPSVGIGYTIMFFDVSGTDTTESTDTQSGFNLNFGVAYDIYKKFFVQFQYDFVKLGAQDNLPDISFNTNIHLIKVGVGYKL
ncbi:outer membrane protein [Aquimarina sp. 2201CG14-23]|uniref:outer membrane protein n=1 Tax=Aquimarina mycalae TaxID=3040073 RepID=UPI002477F60B|nr:outer membrane beta-barrel protein [Aquimarina sp. 2201CG14-23]MDH7448231.1 outer membrane beta-barrel protein [Aquimarina sp. 2201CG14-23]